MTVEDKSGESRLKIPKAITSWTTDDAKNAEQGGKHIAILREQPTPTPLYIWKGKGILILPAVKSH